MGAKPHKLMTPNTARRDHYWLIAGEVMFEDLTQDGVQGSVRLNAVVSTETQAISAEQIGKAQQQLQALFFRQMQMPLEEARQKVKVVDVFTLSISWLGRMTKEEFHGTGEVTTAFDRPARTALS